MAVIVCPSGLSLELRGLKGKELQLLEDKAAKKTGRTYDNILSACTLAVVTPGPYEFTDRPEWDKTLAGDKLFALLCIRAETFGPAYDFDVTCKACEERIKWSISLPGDLPLKKLSDEDAAAFRLGTPIKTTLSDGTGVAFRLPVGADERAVALSKSGDTVLPMLSRRIVSIDGATDVRKYLEECGLRDIRAIVKAFDEHDCGVDTDIQIKCSKCEHEQEVRLPLGRNFWMPME